MNLKSVVRCIVILGALAALGGSLGACHSRAHDAWHRAWHK